MAYLTAKQLSRIYSDYILKASESKKAINKVFKTELSVCLDFDGVIHSYKSGWKGATNIPDDPVDGSFDFLYKLIESGAKIYILSARSGQSGGISAMKNWIKKWDDDYKEKHKNITSDLINQLDFPTTKPPADIYIDDNGYRFSGNFPSIDKLKSLKSWTKK